MQKNFFQKISNILYVVTLVTFFGVTTQVFAAGNISPTQKYSQFLQQASGNIDLNTDGVNDFINWSPGNGGATVSDSTVTGFIWGDSVGWINLGPFNSGAGPDAGVKNTCGGILSGYAWGQNTGWINFAPTNATGANQPKINTTTGTITGTVWSQNYGWIQLSSPVAPALDPASTSGLVTSWHGCTSPGGGGGGGGGGGTPILTVVVNVVNNQSGSATPGSFTLDVQQGGSTIFGAPFNGSSNGTTVSVATNTTYHVYSPNAGNYTAVYTGACNASGNVTITGQNQTCTITFFDAPNNNHPDYCPNLSGNQSSVPAGYTVDAQGDCVKIITPPTPTDVCPNISGNQSSIPTGYHADNQGNCIIDSITSDVCPNISGNQSVIPGGYTIDNQGNCIKEILPPPVSNDKCPNIAGTQFIIPLGFVLDSQGMCVPVSTYVDDNPTIPTILSGGFTLPDSVKASWLWPVLGLLGLLAGLPGLISRFGHILLTLVLWKRRRPYGIVYDSVTKEPLDPAYVSVINVETGEEAMSAITDMEGRYGFLLKQGTYKIVAHKTHYVFPSQKLYGHMNDEVFDNLYFGEPFTIAGDEAVITLNIPMDMIAEDWNQIEKRKMGILEYVTNNHKFWDRLFLILFIVGFITSVVITFMYPVLWNIVMTLLYVVIAILQALGYGPVKVGTITYQGNPLPQALIRIYNKNLNREVGHKITNEKGGYFMLVPKGDYYITVQVRNPDGSYHLLATSDTVHAKNGVVNHSLNL